MEQPRGILLIFLDGVGIGVPDPEVNPFASARLGFFPGFLDPGTGRTMSVRFPPQGSVLAREGRYGAADACLGVSGTPQSATGQATLFTGINCAKVLGHHLTAFPNEVLRAIVREENLLVRAVRSGRSAAFLNTYTPLFHEMGWPHSVSTVTALSLGRPLFGLEDMLAGKALYHDITQHRLRRRYGARIPVFDPEEAGARLARAAQSWDLALFEHFWTDRVGHRGEPGLAMAQVETVERFLAGVLGGLPRDRWLVVLTSDHGNLEDLSTRGHTRNPVPISAWGPGADEVIRRTRDLTDVAPVLLDILGPAPGR